MKLCPQCYRCYEDRFISCAHDQSILFSDRRGARQLKAAGAGRRARPINVTYATALVLGIVGGLLIGGRGASVSSSTTFQAIPAAEAAERTERETFAETTEDVRVEEPSAVDAVTASPVNAATPVIGGEQTVRRAPLAVEAATSKDLEAISSVATAGPDGEKAAIESNQSTGR